MGDSKFTGNVKEFVRLHEQKQKLMEQVRNINANMKDINEQIVNHMANNEIPGIEYGEYNLKYTRTQKKAAISEKLLKNSSYFSNTEDRDRFLQSLSSERGVTQRDILKIRKKV